MPHIRELAIQSKEAFDYARIDLRTIGNDLLDPRMDRRYCERESVETRYY